MTNEQHDNLENLREARMAVDANIRQQIAIIAEAEAKIKAYDKQRNDLFDASDVIWKSIEEDGRAS